VGSMMVCVRKSHIDKDHRGVSKLYLATIIGVKGAPLNDILGSLSTRVIMR
jgi:hypothetical protein